jgi:hypothetical protein
MINRHVALFASIALSLSFTPRAVDAKPRVAHRLHHIWQGDPAYADVVARLGKNSLCGPTSLAMVLLDVGAARSSDGLVARLTDECGTTARGTNIGRLVSCARTELDGVRAIDELGVHIGQHRRAPTARDLSRASRHLGLLHIGWWSVIDGTRDNGHNVVLVGRDAADPRRFYIDNPSRQYRPGHHYDAIELVAPPQALRARLPNGSLMVKGLRRRLPEGAHEVAIVEDVIGFVPLTVGTSGANLGSRTR